MHKSNFSENMSTLNCKTPSEDGVRYFNDYEVEFHKELLSYLPIYKQIPSWISILNKDLQDTSSPLSKNNFEL